MVDFCKIWHPKAADVGQRREGVAVALKTMLRLLHINNALFPTLTTDQARLAYCYEVIYVPCLQPGMCVCE